MSEGGEEQKPDAESKKEEAYEVKLSGRVFGYFANRLAPIYKKELEDARRDGSFENIEQFHKSGLGNLMPRVLDKFEGKAIIPDSVKIDLSQNDINLILDKIKPSTSFGDRQIYSEMVKDLKGDFQSAKLSTEAKRLVTRVLQTLIVEK